MTDLQKELVEFGKELIINRCRRKPIHSYKPGNSVIQKLQTLVSVAEDSDIHVENIFQRLTGANNIAPLPIAPLQLNKIWQEHEPEVLLTEFLENVENIPSGRSYFTNFCYLVEMYGARLNAGSQEMSVTHYWKLVAALSHCCNDEKEIATKTIILFSGDVSGLFDFMQTKTSNMAAKNARARSFFVQLLSDAILRNILRELNLTRCNLLFYGASRFLLLLPGDLNTQDKLEIIQKTISIRLLQLYHGLLAPQFAHVTLGIGELFDAEKIKKHLANLFKKTSQSAYQRFQNIPDELAEAFQPYGEGAEQVCNWCGIDLENDKERYVLTNEGTEEWVCSQCQHYGWTGKKESPGLAQCIAHTYHEGKVLSIRNLITENHLHVMEWGEMTKGLPINVRSRWIPGSSYDNPTWREALAYLGYDYEFRDEKEIEPEFEGEIVRFNPGIKEDSKTIHLYLNNEDITTGWRWAGFATPMQETEGNEFEYEVRDTGQFCKDVPSFSEPKGVGVPRYGTLYLDGDGMGSLFYSCKSIFQYLLLSDSVSLFFEGRVNQLCNEAVNKSLPGLVNEIEQTAYLLYAGGDDLLIVGPWTVLPLLALQISIEYAQYTSFGKVLTDKKLSFPDNPPVSISASMAFAEAKFPLYQLIRSNMNRMETAKDFWSEWADEHKKDQRGGCVDFFGQFMPWFDFQSAMQMVNKFTDLMLQKNGEPDLARHFLQRLYAIAESYHVERNEENKEKDEPLPIDKPYLGRWIWLGMYSLTRAAIMAKKNESAVKNIMQLQQELIGQNNNNHNKKNESNNTSSFIGKHDELELIDKLATITRWLDLRTRKEDQSYE